MTTSRSGHTSHQLPDLTPVSGRSLWPLVLVGIVFVLGGLRLSWLVDRYAVNILFHDQWKFDDATLFEQHSWIEIFRWQHGPHRQGLGGVFSKVVGPLIHWNSRYEAYGIVAILLLSAVLALWLKQRLLGKIDYVDCVIPLLFLTPVQYQVFLEGVNPSHGPLPVLLVVLYCLAWTISDQRARWAIVLSINLLLIYTGFGLFIGIITPLLLLDEYRRKRNRFTILITIIALLSLGSFFIGYTINPAADCFLLKPTNPIHYLLFVGFMFSTFVGVQPVFHLVIAIFLGLTLLFAFVWVFGRAVKNLWREPSSKGVVVFALGAYSLLFVTGTAYGRICLGLAAAQASRYTCYTALAFFFLYLAARLARSSGWIAGVLCLALMSSLRVHPQDRTLMVYISESRRNWRDCYLMYHDIARCDLQTGFSIYSAPEPPDLQRKLDFLELRHLNLYGEKVKR